MFEVFRTPGGHWHEGLILDGFPKLGPGFYISFGGFKVIKNDDDSLILCDMWYIKDFSGIAIKCLFERSKPCADSSTFQDLQYELMRKPLEPNNIVAMVSTFNQSKK
jgi:hypothetical protein